MRGGRWPSRGRRRLSLQAAHWLAGMAAIRYVFTFGLGPVTIAQTMMGLAAGDRFR